MKDNLIFKIVSSELSLEEMKSQCRIEEVVNSNMVIDEKVKQIKSILKEMVVNELMLQKFTGMITN